MPDLTLVNIIKEWVIGHKWDFSCFGTCSIVHPCECGSQARYATIGDDRVGLVSTECSCVDCARTAVLAGDPEFFNLLEKSLRSRIVHESVVYNNHLKSGDDIQHAVDHFQHNKIFISGKFENQQVDLKDSTLVISDGTVTGCEFKNINNPIEIKGDAIINGCSFWMGPKSPYISALYEL